MRPKDRPPTVHLFLHLAQTQFVLTAPTALQILLKAIHALMNLLMLPQQLRRVAPGLELWHLLREDREDVLFFDGVVGAEVRAELEARRDELFQGEVGRPLVVEAGVVEHLPGLAEVVVLVLEPISLPSSHRTIWAGMSATHKILHMLRHRIIRSKVCGAQLG
jgi:hypothetical protein